MAIDDDPTLGVIRQTALEYWHNELRKPMNLAMDAIGDLAAPVEFGQIPGPLATSIGYAPRWKNNPGGVYRPAGLARHLTTPARTKRSVRAKPVYQPASAVVAGLLFEIAAERYADVYHDCIMFALRDPDGTVRAFSNHPLTRFGAPKVTSNGSGESRRDLLPPAETSLDVLGARGRPAAFFGLHEQVKARGHTLVVTPSVFDVLRLSAMPKAELTPISPGGYWFDQRHVDPLIAAEPGRLIFAAPAADHPVAAQWLKAAAEQARGAFPNLEIVDINLNQLDGFISLPTVSRKFLPDRTIPADEFLRSPGQQGRPGQADASWAVPPTIPDSGRRTPTGFRSTEPPRFRLLKQAPARKNSPSGERS